MTIYDDEVFKMACDQFQVIADYLSIDKNDRDRLMYPKRAIAVTLPVHMDDGSTKTFQGYRVQHHLTLGPTKGGTRFAPSPPGTAIGPPGRRSRTGGRASAPRTARSAAGSARSA